MNTGQYISGAAHLGLIAYVLFGGFFVRPEPRSADVTTDVSIYSEAQFAALTRPPEAETVTPEVSAPVTDSAPAARPERETPPADAAPETPTPVAPEPTPEPPAPVAPEEVVDTPPDIQPEPEPSPEDPGAGEPEVSDTPTPRDIPRVAPEAVTTPESQSEVADTPTPEVSDDAPDEAEQVEDRPAAAPEEATTEIVTEAETPSGMSSSPRPKSRPANLAARAAEAQEAEEPVVPATPDPATEAADAIAEAAAQAAAALAAEAASETPSAPTRGSGPPLTAGEKEGLRVAVSRCWNVGAMSSEALRTVITVAVAMNPDGTPITESIRLIGHSGGSDASAQDAYNVARRAIVRCGANGFNLPSEKFGQWQNIEMTFDPEEMRYK